MKTGIAFFFIGLSYALMAQTGGPPALSVAEDLGPVAEPFSISPITLVLTLTPERQAALTHFLAAQQNPVSPDFHRWITPVEFADRFGRSEAEIGALTEWLGKGGLQVLEVARGRTWVQFHATAGQLRAHLGVDLHRYRAAGRVYFANAAKPVLPKELRGMIAGFDGLSDFRLRPASHRSVRPLFELGSGLHSMVPGDFSTIYNINPLYLSGTTGAGQSLVIAGQSGVNVADIDNFRAQYGLPPSEPVVTAVGDDPGLTGEDQFEADLDIEWAGAVAPNAKILYVYAKNVFDAVRYAVNQNLAPVLSMSYGGCEAQDSPGNNVLAQQANAQGMTWIAPAGDTGAAFCDGVTQNNPAVAMQGPSVAFPASYPEVTGVGGTVFNEGSGSYWSGINDPNFTSALSYIPETAWNESGTGLSLLGGGGGASVHYAKPLWQNVPGVPADGARDVPDVSLAASPDHDGYLIISGGQSLIAGGTSASTPVFAGIVALLNQSLVSRGVISAPGLGNINPSLYRLSQTVPTMFHDITSGDNVVPCQAGSPGCVSGSFGFFAGPGYDQVTGLGSVSVADFVNNWQALPVVASSITATASPNPVYQQAPDANGNPWQFTLKLSETGGGATKLTGFTVSGQDYTPQIKNFFGVDTIEPYDSVTAKIGLPAASVPAVLMFTFSGNDPGGANWTRQLSVQLLGPKP